MQLPIRVSRRCHLTNMTGKVEIIGGITPGMIHIGYGKVGIFSDKKDSSVWNVRGKIVFRGKCSLGNGIRMNIAESGTVTFGKEVNITAHSSIDCQKEITFGDGCLISWENLFIDSDHHHIFDQSGKLTNPPKSIIIGKKVWIGCRCLILKGTAIADECVVAAGSILNGTYNTSNSIIAGSPAKIVRENIYWQA